MPAGPHPVGGTIYDHQKIAVANATTNVLAINITKSTDDYRVLTSGVTDATDGSYSLELTDMRKSSNTDDVVGLSDGDEIQLHAWDENGDYYVGQRFTVNTEGEPPTHHLYLHPGAPALSDCKFLGGFASNSNSSATYFHIYNIKNNALVARIDIPANNTVALPSSLKGVLLKGGMCIIYTGDGANVYTSFVRSVG